MAGETEHWSSSSRAIRPALLVPLDPTGEQLAAGVVLALAAHQPAALPFLCSVGIRGVRDPSAMVVKLRRGFEEVTDLRERESAILAGYHVEDDIRVCLCFALGAEELEGERITSVVEAVHRAAADFLKGSGLEVHVVTFLPDLTTEVTPEDRRGAAYAQLASLDRLAAAQPDGTLPATAVDFTWILDSRTRAGAHAGGADSILEPAAYMLGLMVHDPAGTGLETAPGRARWQHLERPAVYSSFGLAVVDHRPEIVARMVAARTAAALLAEYDPAAAAEDGESAAGTRPAPPRGAVVEEHLRAWAERVELIRKLTDVAHPELRGADPLDQRRSKLRQQRHRQAGLDALRGVLRDGVREWLAAGGAPLAQACCTGLAVRGVDDDPDAPLPIPDLSLSELYASLLDDIEATGLLLALERRCDELMDRERVLEGRLAEAERPRNEPEPRDGEEEASSGDEAPVASGEVVGDPGAQDDPEASREPPTASDAAEPEAREADNAEDLQKELAEVREALAKLTAARKDVSEMRIDPDALDELLREFVKPAQPTVPADVPQPPPPPDVVSAATPRRPTSPFQRVLRSFRRGAAPTTPAEVEPTPSTTPEPAPTAPQSRALWILPERMRWLRGYESILDEIRHALLSHRGDVRDGFQYYAKTAKECLDLAARGTAFHITPLAKADLDRIAGESVPAVRAALAAGPPFAVIAAHFDTNVPPLPDHALRHVERLERLDDWVMGATRKAMQPFLERSLGSIVEEYRPGRSLADLARMLVEASEPLARPEASRGIEPWKPVRWLRGDGEFIDLLSNDEQAAGVLSGAGIAAAPGPASTLALFGSFVHGFTAQSLSKVIAYRAHALNGGGLPDGRDLVSDAALLEPSTAPAVQALVLARLLGVLKESRGGLEFDGTRIPADPLEGARALALSVEGQALAARLQARLDEELERPDAVERLREIEARGDLGTLEQRVILEVLTNLMHQMRVQARTSPVAAGGENG